ncbi:hypothetical protein NW766_011905 [Fusarium irregulare]|uniref:Uncharacterized protein n=1 Tax=Fusarium irregulare TaxID=2494466 RepID=A0A9W8PEF1_9HYPO|nr:hypothetical protein NW766_011905 [Fusarium irregulare]
MANICAIQFREQTLGNQRDVKFLTQQYKTGPVENRSDKKTPYLEVLNKDLADGLVNLEKTAREVRDKYSDWEKNAATAVSTCWLGPLGWLVMGDNAAKADGLRHEYDSLQALIERLRQDQQEEITLIVLVNQLIAQSTDIEQKIIDAIAATEELSQLFNNQAYCYDKIAVSIDRMKPGEDLRVRKEYVQNQMKVTVSKLRELKVVAEEFTRSMMNQVRI